ncbi:hypothetical protein PRUPE_6G241100, partial [Prunus persica]
ILLAIILPPLGVLLRYGCKVQFWFPLLLTLLGYIPRIIFAIYVFSEKKKLTNKLGARFPLDQMDQASY